MNDLEKALRDLYALYSAVVELREAQKAYMADRGNDQLGAVVGKAAANVDSALRLVDSNQYFGRNTSWHLYMAAPNLAEALGFAASCIKSGESWSNTCEEVIGGALDEAKGWKEEPEDRQPWMK